MEVRASRGLCHSQLLVGWVFYLEEWLLSRKDVTAPGGSIRFDMLTSLLPTQLNLQILRRSKRTGKIH